MYDKQLAPREYPSMKIKHSNYQFQLRIAKPKLGSRVYDKKKVDRVNFLSQLEALLGILHVG